MNIAEYAGWATVGAILIVQLIQQMILDHKFQIQLEDMRQMREQQTQLKNTVQSLETNIQSLRQELNGYAVVSANLAAEVRTLAFEVTKVQNLVVTSTERRD